MDDTIFLTSERLLQKANLGEYSGVKFEHGETQQAGGDVERWYDTSGEVKFANNEVEDDAENKASDHGPHSDLLRPRRHRLVPEGRFHQYLVMLWFLIIILIKIIALLSLHS